MGLASVVPEQPDPKVELEQAIADAIHAFEKKAPLVVVGISIKRYSDDTLGWVDALTVSSPSPPRRRGRKAA
jgi:hypothetical protein